MASSINALNKYYPLLTDGKNLFAITMNLATKRRRVKDSMRKEYQLFQEEKKKKRSEPKQTVVVAAKETKPSEKSRQKAKEDEQ